MKSEIIIYKGVRFRRYPNSSSHQNRNYFKPDAHARRRGIKALHQEIYRDHHGPIPDGMHVHHADGNSLNNDPANLVLKTPGEHARMHVTPELIAAGSAALRREQPKRIAWLKTEEGRAAREENQRLRQEGFQAFRNRKTEIVCQVCGTTAMRSRQSDGSEAIHCSRKCTMLAFKARNGLLGERREVKCEVCGTLRVTSRKAWRWCSRTCKSKARSGQKKE